MDDGFQKLLDLMKPMSPEEASEFAQIGATYLLAVVSAINGEEFADGFMVACIRNPLDLEDMHKDEP